MAEEKVYCMRCKKDLSDLAAVDIEQCPECGGKNFISGNTVVLTKDGFQCKCGGVLRKTGHFNMNPRYITTYGCEGCGNLIVTETYYESPYV